MPKRCFVISPIGETNSEVREHADDVFEFIIKPAMAELDIHVYRADHNQEIGRITDQMFKSILEDDLCIAILTYRNPNVFYELAVAQCAGRPVIILVHRGESIPFDLKDMRAIEYDLRPRPLRDKVYVKQIMEIVRNLDGVQWDVGVPFGKDLTPLGRKSRHLHLYDRVENFGPSERWLGLVRSTRTSFDVSGIALRYWTKMTGWRTSFLEKAEQGCKIRFLIMHPENPALPQFIDPGHKIGGIEHLATEIRGMHGVFTEMAAIQPNIQVRQVRRGCLTNQIVKTDDLMLLSLLLYSRGTFQSPLLECSPQSPLYQAMEEEFNALWNLNAPEGMNATSVPLSSTRS